MGRQFSVRRGRPRGPNYHQQGPRYNNFNYSGYNDYWAPNTHGWGRPFRERPQRLGYHQNQQSWNRIISPRPRNMNCITPGSPPIRQDTPRWETRQNQLNWNQMFQAGPLNVNYFEPENPRIRQDACPTQTNNKDNHSKVYEAAAPQTNSKSEGRTVRDRFNDLYNNPSTPPREILYSAGTCIKTLPSDQTNIQVESENIEGLRNRKSNMNHDPRRFLFQKCTNDFSTCNNNLIESLVHVGNGVYIDISNPPPSIPPPEGGHKGCVKSSRVSIAKWLWVSILLLPLLFYIPFFLLAHRHINHKDISFSSKINENSEEKKNDQKIPQHHSDEDRRNLRNVRVSTAWLWVSILLLPLSIYVSFALLSYRCCIFPHTYLHLGKISTSPIEISTNVPDIPLHKKQKKVKFRNLPRSLHENTSTTVKIPIANIKTYEIELNDPKVLE